MRRIEQVELRRIIRSLTELHSRSLELNAGMLAFLILNARYEAENELKDDRTVASPRD